MRGLDGDLGAHLLEQRVVEALDEVRVRHVAAEVLALLDHAAAALELHLAPGTRVAGQ